MAHPPHCSVGTLERCRSGEVAAKSQAEQFPPQSVWLARACAAFGWMVWVLRGLDFHHFPQAKAVLHRQSTEKARRIANAYC